MVIPYNYSLQPLKKSKIDLHVKGMIGCLCYSFNWLFYVYNVNV